MIYLVLDAFLLTLAISMDVFAACFGYGLSKIKLPFRSVLLMTIVNTLVLGLSILLGVLLGGAISAEFAKWLSFSLMLAVGIFKFFSELFKIWLLKRSEKPVKMKIFHFRLILNVIADSNNADIDKNKVITIGEALGVGFVLSLDQIGVGLSYGMSNSLWYVLLIFDFLMVLGASLLGTGLGKKMSSHIKTNLSWLSGLILIILAVVKLFVG